jgi:hypothetical protein
LGGVAVGAGDGPFALSGLVDRRPYFREYVMSQFFGFAEGSPALGSLDRATGVMKRSNEAMKAIRHLPVGLLFMIVLLPFRL